MTPERWQKIKLILEEAVEVESAERTSLLDKRCGNDAELRSEVESLLDLHNSSDSALEQDAFSSLFHTDSSTLSAGESFGKYKIIREIGTGGMGSVFLAERADSDFEQKVAIKIIRLGLHSDDLRRRFVLERQILASLEHPNIARLIDGGTTEGGEPFLVMEYVEGTPINKYCESNDLKIEARLDLFREVCGAVSFAHQKLVIHRDLKPSNILITNDGQVKLLDFGIAKILKADPGDETLTQSIAFTPDYASPEQIRGEELSTATDIYSLGIILFELLTCDRPFHFSGKNFGDIVQTATNKESPVPSTFSKLPEGKLKGDLDNIILKALKKEPVRRYSSVEQFSEDIRRHLKGLPVTARQDTWTYRAEKFTRRNPLVVGASALALIILIGGIATTLYQARKANFEREKAERRFNDVRTLANSFMFEINEEIEKSPIKGREMLVTKALQYLDSLAVESDGDVEIQRELATSYEKIGDIQAQLFNPAAGKSAAALLSQQKALQIREKLFDGEPQNIMRGRDLAKSRVLVGDILSMMGNVSEASNTYLAAIRLNSDLLKLEPENRVIQQDLARNYARLGQSVLRSGSLGKALENYDHSLSIYTELIKENPEDATLQRSLSIITSYIGYVKMEIGSSDEALRFFGDSLRIVENQTTTSANSEQSRSDLSVAHLWFGVALSEAGDADNSLIHIRKALQIQTTIFEADRQNFGGQNSLADCYLELGRALVQKAQKINLKRSSAPIFADAVKGYQEAIKNYEAVWQNDRQNFSAERQIAFTKLHLGRTLQLNGDRSQALSIFRQTLLTLEKLTQKDPNNTEWQYDVAVCHLRIAEISKSNSDIAQVTHHLQKALTMLETLSANSPENVRIKNDLAKARNGFDKT